MSKQNCECKMNWTCTHIFDGEEIITANTAGLPTTIAVVQKRCVAQLIASAPDLLEACKAALELIKTLNGVWPKEEKFLRDAILKAEAQE